MRLIKLVAAVILGNVAVANGTDNLGGCGSMTTIVITTVATITESIQSNADPGYSLVSTLSASTTVAATDMTPVPETSTEMVTTHTVFETVTSVISTVQGTPTATTTAGDEGPYYFSVHNGITTWLGGHSPAPSISYVIKTSTVVIQPFPTMNMLSSTEDSQATSTENIHITSTSTKTIRLTTFITERLTETLTVSSTSGVSGVASTSTGYSPYKYSSYGWNATASRFKTISLKTGSGMDWPGYYATGSPSGTAPHSIAYPKVPAYAPRGLKLHGREPQVGAIVTATINGVVVSWTNLYDGATTLASSTAHSSPTATIKISVEPTLTVVSLTSITLLPKPAPSTSSSSFSTIAGTMGSTSSIPTAGAVPMGPPHHSYPHLSTRTPTMFSTHPTSSSGPTGTITSVPFSNASSTSSGTASATSAACTHEAIAKGNFTINFDDLPTFSASPNTTDYPPIFNTYHKLFWSQGFAYAPPPSDPYPPISPPQLAIFVVNGSANVHSENFTGTPPPGQDVNGEFGAGPRFMESAFWIDAYSAYLGCNNKGPSDCQLSIRGYAYEPDFKNVVLIAEQYAYQPACPLLINCNMIEVNFKEDFRNLTGIQVVATATGSEEPIAWFMDDLRVGWSDNSCAAGALRDHVK